MSFVKDFLFGEPAEPARIEDVRSGEQRVLGGDVSRTLRGLLDQGGLTAFQGPMVAPVTGAENNLLGILSGLFEPDAAGRQGVDLGQQALNRFTTGGGAVPLPGQAQSRLDQFITGGRVNPLVGTISQPDMAGVQSQIGDLITGRTLDANHPFIRNQVDAVSRPILEQFGDDIADLRSQATAAGQFVQPGSSSPFEMAQSRREVGLANALGDAAAGVVLPTVNAERNRQVDMTRFLSGLIEADTNRAQDTLGLMSGLFDRGADRSLRAATSQVPFQQGQITGINRALEGAALPRMVSQFGLDRGLSEFARQQNSFLGILNAAMQQSQPQNVSIPGTEGTSGFLGAALPALASSFAGPVGGALAGLIPGVGG